MQKIHGGSGIPHGTMRGKGAHKPEATTSGPHGGSGRPKGVVHAPPPPGGAVNKGGTFGMGTLKKRK